MREFAEQLYSLRVVSSRGVFGRYKSTDIDGVIIQADLREPSHSGLIPRNTFESAGVGCFYAPVPFIFGAIAFAQIRAAVIKRVVVPVVSFFSSAASQNETVHIDEDSFRLPDCVEFSSGRLERTPVPLHQPLVVSGVNESILPSRQWNKAIRWVGWLGNWMPLHSAFRHESSAKGFVQPNYPTTRMTVEQLQ